MPDLHHYNRTLPLKKRCDVLVIGAGPAGVAAAVTAARCGADVFVLESLGCAGGMGTAGLVPAFMRFGDGVHFLAGDFGREILARMNALSDKVNEWDGIYNIPAEALKRAYDNILGESGADVRFFSSVVDVVCENNRIAYVVVSSRQGLYAVEAGMYIDTTGDANIAAWCGVPFDLGGEDGRTMGGSLCSLWSGIEWDRVGENDARMLEKAFQDGIFTHPDRHLPGMFPVGFRQGGGNIGHLYFNGTDECSMTAAVIEGRKLLDEYKRYYKEYLTGFEDMELSGTASLLGVRESRRIRGDYQMTLDDYLRRADFPDEIGRFSYPVDIHGAGSTDEEYETYFEKYSNLRYNTGESYGIPYRILLPQKIDNLLTAGRCVSTDRYVQSSLRVMPGCFITGQAAGAAAALSIQQQVDPRKLEISCLRHKLQAMGGYLPEPTIPSEVAV